MSNRRSRYELVHDAFEEQPWHVRTVLKNGRKGLWSENYVTRAAALRAILLNAEMFWSVACFNADETRIHVDSALSDGGIEVRHIEGSLS